MNEERLRRALSAGLHRLRQKGIDRPLRVVVYPLQGQMPGEYLPEADERIHGTIDAFSLASLGSESYIYCSGGTADCDGLTSAHYMEKQVVTFARDRGRRNIESAIVIGQQVSSHTAEDIRISRQFLLHYDLIVPVSNWPHLIPAGVYFKYCIPEVPFVKWSSGSGRGCLGLPYSHYLAREYGHWAFAALLDCRFYKGRFLDERQARIAEAKRSLRFPPVPYRPEPYFIQPPGT